MKVKRHKHTRKTLKFYATNFNIDTKSFNVLIDGTFANEALNSKINIADQMPTFFDVDSKKCKLYTTKCAINETVLLGKPTYGAMLILKQYELVECNHKRQYVSSEKCFKNIILDSIKSENRSKYFVATQSESLKDIIRDIAGVPLLILSHSAINLEKPSAASIEVVNKSTNEKLNPEGKDFKVIQDLKKKLLDNDKKQVKRLHKKRKVKGPNPLSCLKKKKKPTNINNNYNNNTNKNNAK